MADDFVTIPVIEIVPGWSVDDLETIEDCQDAHIKVMALQAEIEYQIDSHDAKHPIDQDLEWLARAKRALKFKKIAAQCINNTRAQIAKQQKQDERRDFKERLIEIVKANVDHHDFDSWVKQALRALEDGK